MGSILYGKYIDAVSNIGLYLPVFVSHKVWVYRTYRFKDNPSHCLPRGGGGKGNYYLKEVINACYGFI